MSKKDSRALAKAGEIIDVPSVNQEKLEHARAKLTDMDEHPDTYMDVLVSVMGQGRDILGLCITWGVNYGDLINWIIKDNSRYERYTKALETRSTANIEMVLHQLYAMATSDVRQLYDADGRMKPPHEWPPEIAQAVEAIKTDELFEGVGRERTQIGETKQIKLWSKVKAIELLGKHLKMFTDKIEHSGSVTLEDLVGGSREGSKDTSSS